MKKFLTVAVTGAALALSGCGKSDDKPANPAGTVKREAGNWKTDVKLVKFEMPGVPENVKDQMSKQLAAASGTEQCLTQEQADNEDVAGALSQGYGQACTWNKNRIADGKIDVAGTCTQGSQKVELALAGSLDARKSDVLVTSKGKSPMGGGDMEMQMQVTSTNIGPCKG
ncbi:MAG: DUF3617 domain-containing protein [Sphingopyxis sp.]|uniref:DUF3617 domain-containing protein n=1 Tax=Sphingopyxis sp. TaxID=1908224 RepID=UPI001A25F501|nr:DUF3617 domain-containing protein [Sphingopyxis sp.]MBJ7499182.1 DUF3617 domain-containing protein [Sphingopyxis sp.]